jgi:hypothetical protein
MNLSNATPRVYIRNRDIDYISQDLNLDEDTILEVFDYLSTREIVDIVVRD